MKNILIDTCSWIDLLDEHDNKLLPHLVFWKDNNYINIICNQVIIEEWNKHKDLQRRKFTDSAATKYAHLNEVSKKEKLNIPNLKPSIDNVENQISTIDKLISDAKILEIDNDIKAYISDRNIAKKAPFHNKIDSTKDAYIIYSALKHFTESEEGFIFISANKNEFGNPANLTREIHTDLIEDYKDVKLDYYSEIGRAINQLKQDLPMVLSSDTENEEIENDSIYIDKSKEILDQLYDYILIMHKEIKFVPLNIFINNYPFKTTKNSYANYNIFSIFTENEELCNLMYSFTISDSNEIEISDNTFFETVLDSKEKLKRILIGFTQNHIFNITHFQTRQRKEIRLSEHKYCDCPKCCFNNFLFVDCFNSINSYDEEELEDLYVLGYLQYQIGNYLTSVNILRKAFAKATAQKHNIKAFIIQFNLNKLSNFIRNTYFGENGKPELIQELKDINLPYLAKKFGTKENLKTLDFLNSNEFYIQSKNKIQVLTSKIIDCYYSQLNGGYSSNSYISELINEFANFESFIRDNHIMFDKFIEFKDITQIFIEGLFAGHGINPQINNSSRLEEFDDWVIEIILNHGDPDKINKFYRRYKIKRVKYARSSFSKDSFTDLIDNFFTKNELLVETFLKTKENSNPSFWKYYGSIFNNIMTLVSICEFEKNYYNLFAEKLFTYLNNEQQLHETNIKFVSTFLYRCGKEIDIKLLEAFFKNSIKKAKYHNHNFFEAISDCFNSHNKKISITKADFNKIIKCGIETCNICKKDHPATLIIPIYLALEDENYKREIGQRIEILLNESFDFQLFHLATIYEIIEFNDCLFQQALKDSLPKGSKVSFRSVFSGDAETRYENVGNLLNICFKLNLDVTSNNFDEIRKLGDYYEWLLDMENFDYSKFNHVWIGEYTTRFYYKRIAKSKKLKEVLDYLIKKNYDSNLEHDYLNIFIRKTWDL